MKHTIAVIGTGDKRSMDVLKLLVKGNCRLLVYSNDQQNAGLLLHELKKVNPGLDAEIIECKIDASWESDIILFALPAHEIIEAASQIKQVACQKVVLSLYSRTSEMLRSLLPNSRIVTVSEDFTIDVNDPEVTYCLNNFKIPLSRSVSPNE
jgi:8-hydroxy-5-deazaflavin:NADPH oxidoreductase